MEDGSHYDGNVAHNERDGALFNGTDSVRMICGSLVDTKDGPQGVRQ